MSLEFSVNTVGKESLLHIMLFKYFVALVTGVCLKGSLNLISNILPITTSEIDTQVLSQWWEISRIVKINLALYSKKSERIFISC